MLLIKEGEQRGSTHKPGSFTLHGSGPVCRGSAAGLGWKSSIRLQRRSSGRLSMMPPRTAAYRNTRPAG